MTFSLDLSVKEQIKILFKDLENLDKRLFEISGRIAVTSLPYKDKIDILTSKSGISPFTAIAIIADIADIKRFPNSKHFTSYLRAAPGVEQSNESRKILSVNKYSRKLSLSLLLQSVNNFTASDPHLNRWYKKYSKIKKGKNRYRIGIARKVFAQIYQMLKKSEYNYHRDKILHEKKMNEYYNMANKFSEVA